MTPCCFAPRARRAGDLERAAGQRSGSVLDAKRLGVLVAHQRLAPGVGGCQRFAQEARVDVDFVDEVMDDVAEAVDGAMESSHLVEHHPLAVEGLAIEVPGGAGLLGAGERILGVAGIAEGGVYVMPRPEM